MTGSAGTWLVHLAAAAEADFDEIMQWTARHFGERQANAYTETLLDTLDALKHGPDAVGAKARDDLAKGIFTLHAARSGRKARHLVVFRVGGSHGPKYVQVLRILHDAIELRRHLPARDETEQ